MPPGGLGHINGLAGFGPAVLNPPGESNHSLAKHREYALLEISLKNIVFRILKFKQLNKLNKTMKFYKSKTC